MNVDSIDEMEALGDVCPRQDSRGRWHDVGSAPCEECGCLYDYSIDDLGIIWDAGPAIGPECAHELCDCPVTPVMGIPFHITSHPTRPESATLPEPEPETQVPARLA
jgi:hypothetical protein